MSTILHFVRFGSPDFESCGSVPSAAKLALIMQDDNTACPVRIEHKGGDVWRHEEPSASEKLDALAAQPEPLVKPDAKKLTNLGLYESYPFRLLGTCDARYPHTAEKVRLIIGDPEAFNVTAFLTPNQARELGASLLAHAAYSQAASAWVKAQPKA